MTLPANDATTGSISPCVRESYARRARPGRAERMFDVGIFWIGVFVVAVIPDFVEEILDVRTNGPALGAKSDNHVRLVHTRDDLVDVGIRRPLASIGIGPATTMFVFP